MRKSIRINEYYDLFDVKQQSDNTVSSDINQLPDTIKPNSEYNVFSGFSNWSDFYENNKTLTTPPNTYTANNVIEITGKHKSPQANSSIRVDDNGDIWCFPPNVSVPHWSKIIFRNFDYTLEGDITAQNNYATVLYQTMPGLLSTKNLSVDLTGNINDDNDVLYLKFDDDKLTGADKSLDFYLYDFKEGNIFLKFDEYPSRSKVIFSKSDKTRNPDIEYEFGYAKGQMEPIKLNIALSANPSVYDETNKYKFNHNLSMSEIKTVLKGCYWCIEWIYVPENGD